MEGEVDQKHTYHDESSSGGNSSDTQLMKYCLLQCVREDSLGWLQSLSHGEPVVRRREIESWRTLNTYTPRTHGNDSDRVTLVDDNINQAHILLSLGLEQYVRDVLGNVITLCYE